MSKKKLSTEAILSRVFSNVPTRESITLSQLSIKTDLDFVTVKRWIKIIQLIQNNPKLLITTTEQSNYITVQKVLNNSQHKT